MIHTTATAIIYQDMHDMRVRIYASSLHVVRVLSQLMEDAQKLGEVRCQIPVLAKDEGRTVASGYHCALLAYSNYGWHDNTRYVVIMHDSVHSSYDHRVSQKRTTHSLARNAIL